LGCSAKRSIWQSSAGRLNAEHGYAPVIPDTVKIILVVGAIAGAAFAAVWGLAHFPPEQAEILKSLPHDKIRQN
jgi:hypothetical protein